MNWGGYITQRNETLSHSVSCSRFGIACMTREDGLLPSTLFALSAIPASEEEGKTTRILTAADPRDARKAICVRDFESGFTPLHKALYLGNLGVGSQMAGYYVQSQRMGSRMNSKQSPEANARLANLADHDGFRPVDHVAERLQWLLSSVHQGSLYSWGSSSNEQLGYSARGPVQMMPKRVPHITGEVKAVCVTNWHALALDGQGRLWSCGAARGGILGHTLKVQFEPIKSLCSVSIASIAASDNFCLASAVRGEVYAWGSNTHGQLGLGFFGASEVSNPTLVVLSDAISSVAVGLQHSLALSRAGTVFSFGSNERGQCGHLLRSELFLTPRKIDAFSQSVSSIAAAAHHSICITADGIISALGVSGVGELARTISKVAPPGISLHCTEHRRLRSASTSSLHSTFALSENGVVYHVDLAAGRMTRVPGVRTAVHSIAAYGSAGRALVATAMGAAMTVDRNGPISDTDNDPVAAGLALNPLHKVVAVGASSKCGFCIVGTARAYKSPPTAGKSRSSPSLKALCEAVLIKDVEPHNVVQAVLFALTFRTPLLLHACHDVLACNLDRILDINPAGLLKLPQSVWAGVERRYRNLISNAQSRQALADEIAACEMEIEGLALSSPLESFMGAKVSSEGVFSSDAIEGDDDEDLRVVAVTKPSASKTEQQARAKKIRHKIMHIYSLEARLAAGNDLTLAQVSKLSKLPRLIEELEGLQEQIPMRRNRVHPDDQDEVQEDSVIASFEESTLLEREDHNRRDLTTRTTQSSIESHGIPRGETGVMMLSMGDDSSSASAPGQAWMESMNTGLSPSPASPGDEGDFRVLTGARSKRNKQKTILFSFGVGSAPARMEVAPKKAPTPAQSTNLSRAWVPPTAASSAASSSPVLAGSEAARTPLLSAIQAEQKQAKQLASTNSGLKQKSSSQQGVWRSPLAGTASLSVTSSSTVVVVVDKTSTLRQVPSASAPSVSPVLNALKEQRSPLLAPNRVPGSILSLSAPMTDKPPPSSSTQLRKPPATTGAALVHGNSHSKSAASPILSSSWPSNNAASSSILSTSPGSASLTLGAFITPARSSNGKHGKGVTRGAAASAAAASPWKSPVVAASAEETVALGTSPEDHKPCMREILLGDQAIPGKLKRRENVKWFIAEEPRVISLTGVVEAEANAQRQLRSELMSIVLEATPKVVIPFPLKDISRSFFQINVLISDLEGGLKSCSKQQKERLPGIYVQKCAFVCVCVCALVTYHPIPPHLYLNCSEQSVNLDVIALSDSFLTE